MTTPAPISSPQTIKEIDLRTFATLLWQNRLVIALVTGIALTTGLIYAKLSNPTFESSLTFLPVSPDEQARTGTSALTALLGQFAMTQSTSASPAANVLNILNSRTLSERVVEKLDLLPVLFPDRYNFSTKSWKERTWYGKRLKAPNMQAAARAMKARVMKPVYDLKNGLILIQVTWTDPMGRYRKYLDPSDDRSQPAVLTQKITSTYIEALQDYLRNSETTVTKRQRHFIESQLTELKTDLSRIEEALLIFSEGGSSIEIGEDTLSLIANAGDLLSSISALTIERNLLSQLFKDHPKIAQYDQRLSELQNTLAALRADLDRMPDQPRKIIVPLTKVPILSLEYQRLKKEYALKETIYNNFKAEYEAVRIKEAKEDVTVHIIDPPLPGDQTAPNPTAILAVFGFVGMLLGGLIGILRPSAAQELKALIRLIMRRYFPSAKQAPGKI